MTLHVGQQVRVVQVRVPVAGRLLQIQKKIAFQRLEPSFMAQGYSGWRSSNTCPNCNPQTRVHGSCHAAEASTGVFTTIKSASKNELKKHQRLGMTHFQTHFGIGIYLKADKHCAHRNETRAKSTALDKCSQPRCLRLSLFEFPNRITGRREPSQLCL